MSQQGVRFGRVIRVGVWVVFLRSVLTTVTTDQQPKAVRDANRVFPNFTISPGKIKI